uniref:Uncharacterized protein n=1 Tax=Tanacetum cinerariifolium TaxID=118510 RepID=A0A6L2NAN0_TANCI|nr:hypothetical protein [Tanacetum cinerariifolium]
MKDVKSRLSYSESIEQETENITRHQKRRRERDEENIRKSNDLIYVPVEECILTARIRRKDKERTVWKIPVVRFIALYGCQRQRENEREYQHHEREDYRNELDEVQSPSELLEKNYSMDTSAKLGRAKPDKCSGEAGMSKDMLGLK